MNLSKEQLEKILKEHFHDEGLELNFNIGLVSDRSNEQGVTSIRMKRTNLQEPNVALNKQSLRDKLESGQGKFSDSHMRD